MNVLIDTDVLIDVALERVSFVDDSAWVLDAAQQRQFQAYLAWHSISNFYYIVSSPTGNETAKDFVKDLLSFVTIAPTTTKDALYAVKLGVPDFEDALQIAAARASLAEKIITRNTGHYKQSPIPALTPRRFRASIQKLTR